MASKIPDKAFKMVKKMPRVALNSLRMLPGEEYYMKSSKLRRGRQKGLTSGRGNKGQGQRMTLPRIGFEGRQGAFYINIPKEPYYRGHHIRREYPPISLFQLQRAIDIGRLNTDEPIDLNTLCNTKLFRLPTKSKDYGFNLTDEGSEMFVAQINIEVQWASEQTIAAVERAGGVITTRFYDLECVHALSDALEFFKKGLPIPRCSLPPEDAFEYYTNPKNRGYLADPEKVAEARYELSQKYGYDLTDLAKSPKYEMFKMRKDPRQIFYGLEPGWFVSLKDEVVIKPTPHKYQEYYAC